MRILRIAIFTLAVLIGYAAEAQSPVKPPAKAPAMQPAAPAKAPETPAAMKADPIFVQTYDDMKALDRLIGETEKELLAYRQRQQLKIAALRQWMKEHAVDGYAYDEVKQEFVAPPKKP